MDEEKRSKTFRKEIRKAMKRKGEGEGRGKLKDRQMRGDGKKQAERDYDEK